VVVEGEGLTLFIEDGELTIERGHHPVAGFASGEWKSYVVTETAA
jgi:hypothetical protein